MRTGVDVIVTIEIAGGQAARQATDTIPIVVVNCDPFQELVESLARPGGNVTGQSCMNAELTPKKLELFKGAVPSLAHVAFLYNPKQPGPTLGLKLAQEAARSLRITVDPIEVTDVTDFEPAFTKIARGYFDGLFVYHDFVTASQQSQIIQFAARTKLPAMYGFRGWVDAGGLLSYGTNLHAMFHRAGTQVAKILSGGKPADLAVEQPTTFELVINLKTAKSLGLMVPPAVLAWADEVTSVKPTVWLDAPGSTCGRVVASPNPVPMASADQRRIVPAAAAPLHRAVRPHGADDQGPQHGAVPGGEPRFTLGAVEMPDTLAQSLSILWRQPGQAAVIQ